MVRKDGPSIRLLCGVHPENFGEWQSESEMEREKLALAERIGLRESFRILKWRDRTPLLAECDRCQLKFITPALMLRDDPQDVEYYLLGRNTRTTRARFPSRPKLAQRASAHSPDLTG